jgi:iron complex outermembrane receptor protein
MGGGTVYNLSGKSVPLVSPNTFNLKLERKVNSFNTIIFDLNYVDEKYVSNDPENVEPKIPEYYLANIKLRHLRGPMSLQIGINNLLNEEYYDFAVASTFHDDDHFGLSGVYPLAKRTAYVNLNYEF